MHEFQVNRLFTHESGSEGNSEEHVESKSQDAQKNTSVNTSLEKSASEEISVVFTEEEPVLNDEENKQVSESAEQNANKLFININKTPEDSGLFSAEHSKKESGSSESSGEFLLSEDANNIDRSPAPDTQKSSPMPENIGNIHVGSSPGSSHVCVKLCNLIKAQLGNGTILPYLYLSGRCL